MPAVISDPNRTILEEFKQPEEDIVDLGLKGVEAGSGDEVHVVLNSKILCGGFELDSKYRLDFWARSANVNQFGLVVIQLEVVFYAELAHPADCFCEVLNRVRDYYQIVSITVHLSIFHSF